MDRYLSENLLDGEKILWKGRSEPFRLLAPPYSRSLPLLWTACLSLLTFFAFVFIPFAQQMRVHALQFVLCLMLVILTPLSLCIHSIIDKNIIEKHQPDAPGDPIHADHSGNALSAGGSAGWQ